jgi:uncharacterized membrane protein YedE/YeeE
MISALQFAPYPLALGGGLLIGIASLLLFAFNGRIAGVCGIAFSLLSRRSLPSMESSHTEHAALKVSDATWRWLFLAGLIIGTLLFHFLSSTPFPAPPNNSISLLLIGGLLVGYGTTMGNGCTSGHGVCGIARLSTRSITATLSFMMAAIVSLYVFKHVFGWAI